MLELLGALGGIVLVDLALSGDNALVIGAAASDLPRRQRWLAILLGGGGAIVLRIVFALAVTFLLQLPFLQAVGGVVLLYIAVRLLLDRKASHGRADERSQPRPHEDEAIALTGKMRHRTLWSALVTILIADVTMSLDNVLAIGALAAGQLWVLAVGLLLSIGLVLVGSALVAELSRRLPWLLDVAALALGWTAGNMLLHDLRLGPSLDTLPGAWLVIPAVGALIVLVVDLSLLARRVGSTRCAASRQRTGGFRQDGVATATKLFTHGGPPCNPTNPCDSRNTSMCDHSRLCPLSLVAAALLKTHWKP